ncbi:Rieske (2Fe-2S) protein [Pricia sp. S334]|uniref:Rieske (2Fe-2S) protein n=1 Tax=Pricia mediterranea TaxID=3076079 RepID=A0ABU3L045_9FLAO|nr:Rieske (2Fe-2S) protein [Pricia sp. S334]MDT7827081.1 Rieske (2Fe-2S) protein [Pricia sp. S334]
MEQKNPEKIPNWKSDFPISTEKATHISRREFAKFLGLLSGVLALSNGAIVIKALAFPSKPLEGDHFVCNEDEVPVGKMIQFEIQGDMVIPYILIHLQENEWRAFEQKCTHLACAVRYREEEQKIECPCHNGWFSADTGEVLQGPPPRPLPQLEVVRKEGKVYVRQAEEPYAT